MKKQHRILIVDDEPSARYALRRALESAYDIGEADSAAAAREQIAKQRPDMIVLDMVGDRPSVTRRVGRTARSSSSGCQPCRTRSARMVPIRGPITTDARSQIRR